MADYMRATDALELVTLRIQEDDIGPATALDEFRKLTGYNLSSCINVYDKLKRIHKEVNINKSSK